MNSLRLAIIAIIFAAIGAFAVLSVGCAAPAGGGRASSRSISVVVMIGDNPTTRAAVNVTEAASTDYLLGEWNAAAGVALDEDGVTTATATDHKTKNTIGNAWLAFFGGLFGWLAGVGGVLP